MSSGPPLKRLRQSVLQFSKQPSSATEQNPVICEATSTTTTLSKSETLKVPPVTRIISTVQELDAVVRLVGFRVDDVPGDGNCMYESVSRQLTALGQSCTWQDVKQQLLGHIRQSSTDNASGFDVTAAVLDSYGSVDNYLSKMSQQGAYGDGSVLAMAPFVYGRNVIVYHSDRTINLCEPKSYQNVEPIRIGYVNNNHYVSIVRSILADNGEERGVASHSACGEKLVSEKCDQTSTNDPIITQTGEKRTSTVSSHPWIITASDGYYCQTCKDSSFASGPWVTIPIAKSNSRKLYTKAQKHAQSSSHKMAAEKRRNATGPSVVEQQFIAANRQTEEELSITRQMFRAAYFLFYEELPHTTLWRGFVSTVSALDGSGRIGAHFRAAPANAHHLSTSTITEILHSFGVAMHLESVDKLRRIDDIGEFAILADECTDINGREMLSICIRYINKQTVVERFLCVVQIFSTVAASIHDELVKQMKKYHLDPTKIAAASFDGASNFSGCKGGVQALLKQTSKYMIYVHCRSHVLQLCLVKACSSVPVIKRVVTLLNNLYSHFRGSPQRLHVLDEIEREIDQCSHKLVQPGTTRWLSHEASVDVVCKHYAAICIALEHIYQDGGNLSGDAGGILLTLRKDSTAFILSVLSAVLKPLARLSKSLQCGTGDIVSAMQHAKAVIQSLTEIVESDFTSIDISCQSMRQSAKLSGVRLEVDSENTPASLKAVAKKYLNSIIESVTNRFSDTVGKVADMHTILKSKPEEADFTDISKIFNISIEELQFEWRILRRLDGDLSTAESLIMLCTIPEKRAMFPAFSSLAAKILLMPIGTAGVERSFSTMNRILRSERCRLLPDHVDTLMKISIEGPSIPDVRDGTDEEEECLNSLLTIAINEWNKGPHRGLDE